MTGGIDSMDITRRSFVIGGVAATRAAALANAAQSPADRWRIGCYTRPWAAHDYRVALDAIAEAGFKFAGLMTTNNVQPSRAVGCRIARRRARDRRRV